MFFVAGFYCLFHLSKTRRYRVSVRVSAKNIIEFRNSLHFFSLFLLLLCMPRTTTKKKEKKIEIFVSLSRAHTYPVQVLSSMLLISSMSEWNRKQIRIVHNFVRNKKQQQNNAFDLLPCYLFLILFSLFSFSQSFINRVALTDHTHHEKLLSQGRR